MGLKNQKNETVAAVVVTYNRKQLLNECLEALLKQTRKPDMVFVIDNASTDGTSKFLKEHGYLDNEHVVYKRLKKNIGGSGGFYEGVKMAFTKKYDWIWLMDDDVVPKQDCLECLMKARRRLGDNISFLASSIFSDGGAAMNTPGIELSPGDNGYCDWYKHLDVKAVKISVATFVSILINRKAVDQVGYPVRDYFIWGDDTEYTMRLVWYYAPAYLIGDSKATHKRALQKRISIIDEIDEQRIKMYFYLYRNTMINRRAYFGREGAWKQLKADCRTKMKIITSKNCKLKLKKIHLISKAHWAFLTHKYDLEAFNHRFDKNTKWRDNEQS